MQLQGIVVRVIATDRKQLKTAVAKEMLEFKTIARSAKFFSTHFVKELVWLNHIPATPHLKLAWQPPHQSHHFRCGHGADLRIDLKNVNCFNNF